MDIREYLNNKGIQIKKERGNELIIDCPFCDDREGKGAINSKSGAYNCLHLNRCGVRYSWWNFQKALGDDPKPLNSDKTFYPHKKPVYHKPRVKPKEPDSKIIKYLKKRGFSDETIKYFRIGQQKDDTVILPYYKEGELVNVKYRSITEKKKMWTEKGARNSRITVYNKTIYGKLLWLAEKNKDRIKRIQSLLSK